MEAAARGAEARAAALVAGSPAPYCFFFKQMSDANLQCIVLLTNWKIKNKKTAMLRNRDLTT